jgi:hypothetical protein
MTSTEYRWGNSMVYFLLIYSLEKNENKIEKIKNYFDL